MEETGIYEKETRLRQAVDRLKLEMKGMTEEEWVQAIKKSRKERLPSTIKTSEV
jgi:hypothetical protein